MFSTTISQAKWPATKAKVNDFIFTKLERVMVFYIFLVKEEIRIWSEFGCPRALCNIFSSPNFFVYIIYL